MKLNDIELDAKRSETHARLEAILATVGISHSELIGEEFDIEGDIEAMGLDTPISDADMEAMLAATSAPKRALAFTAPSPPISIGSVKISVRVPARILAAIKARAAQRRQPYQKLLNQALRDAVKGWEATTTPV